MFLKDRVDRPTILLMNKEIRERVLKIKSTKWAAMKVPILVFITAFSLPRLQFSFNCNMRLQRDRWEGKFYTAWTFA